MPGENESGGLSDQDVLALSADIVAAYVGQNTISAGAIPEIIRTVHQTLASLGRGGTGDAPVPAEKQKPAVPISRSVQHDFIVCLEDGKKLKMLKRYLRSRYDMSPEDYRRKWGLAADYPMVAPAYAARRSDFAKKIGLGRGVRRKK
ncbi:MAG: transcriptional regulator, MucR family [Caulobacter sp.]|nr:transcriptional regulator, MucR family [Caulobacter sp.]